VFLGDEITALLGVGQRALDALAEPDDIEHLTLGFERQRGVEADDRGEIGLDGWPDDHCHAVIIPRRRWFTDGRGGPYNARPRVGR
jgi:hypothetical protein